VAKVGTSNPDRAVSLKGCSAQLKNNNNPNGDIHYCLQLLGGIVCVHRLAGRLSQRLLGTSFFKSRNKLNFWPRILVAFLSSLALMTGAFELRLLMGRFELRCILAIIHFLGVLNFPIHLIFL
jgi:hypothetical protein